MDRDEIIRRLAEFFRIEPNENGEYDLDSFEWRCGGFISVDSEDVLCLANVVEALTN